MAPTSVTQLLLLLLFVVPGFVYQAVRISVRGRLPLDIELSTRIVRATVSSGIFALVYLVILGQKLVDAAHGIGYGFEHPRVGALLALLGGVFIPAGLALVRVPEWPWLSDLRLRLPQITKYDPTPTAWDKTFQSAGECFIRVLNQDGVWVAGYYGPASYATSYPRTTPTVLGEGLPRNSRRHDRCRDRRLARGPRRLHRDTLASSIDCRSRGGEPVSRWLPPAGGGYSGRSTKSSRVVSKSTAAKASKTLDGTLNGTKSGKTARSAVSGRFVKVPPKGSAGVSRAE